MNKEAVYRLPYPPSMNRYWRHVGGKVLISRAGREYRVNVAAAVLEQGRKRVAGRLAMTVLVSCPDNRRRDLDNLLKSLLDAMEHAGVYDDDAQIDYLQIARQHVTPGGSVKVRVEMMTP